MILSKSVSVSSFAAQTRPLELTHHPGFQAELRQCKKVSFTQDDFSTQWLKAHEEHESSRVNAVVHPKTGHFLGRF